jgi:hypothetical protein
MSGSSSISTIDESNYWSAIVERHSHKIEQYSNSTEQNGLKRGMNHQKISSSASIPSLAPPLEWRRVTTILQNGTKLKRITFAFI